MAICVKCGCFYPYKRKLVGFDKCIDCNVSNAQAESKRRESMVQPCNKSTPTYISDPELLKQLNPKRTV